MAQWIYKLCFSFCMSLLLSLLMSGWVTYLNLGITDHFWANWLQAFLLAWPAAFAIAVCFGGMVGVVATKLSQRIIGWVQ